MPLGPGKYDRLADMVRFGALARAVILVVIDGNRGSGFSVQAPIEVLSELPGILRAVAEEIERTNMPG